MSGQLPQVNRQKPSTVNRRRLPSLLDAQANQVSQLLAILTMHETHNDSVCLVGDGSAPLAPNIAPSIHLQAPMLSAPMLPTSAVPCDGAHLAGAHPVLTFMNFNSRACDCFVDKVTVNQHFPQRQSHPAGAQGI